MQADTYTIKDILVGERRFIIPPYQRPYVWERRRQWEPLWQDIEDTIARLADGRQDAHAKGADVAPSDEKVAPHFLGAIVLDQMATPAGEIDRRAVVDGQQRLTTIQLFLRGILDALEGADQVPGNLRSQVAKLIRNDDDVITGAETRYKVWPRRAERQAFEDAMAPLPPDAADSRFAAARAFFAEAAGRWLEAEDGPLDPYVDDPQLGRVGLLVAAVRSLLKLVVIDLDGVDDAQVIFEVLNARHTPLTAADLLKNLLFLQAENQGYDVEHLYDTYWQRFDDDWWAVETGVGHATRARQDWLLGDWLVARSAQVVNIGHLYGAAKAWITQSGEKVPDTLASIRQYGEAYERLLGRRSDGLTVTEQRAFAHIRMLNVTAANPLLLWLLTRPTDELSTEGRERAVRLVESFLVRRMAVKWQTRAYGTVFVDVLRKVQDSGDDLADAVAAALLGAPNSYHWPSDDDLTQSFVTARAYGAGGINQRRLRLLLGAVDRRLHAQDHKGEDIDIDYDNLTVEHVMPQSWETSWPIEADTDEQRQLASQQRKHVVQRIGNLTLLTSSLNPGVSNGPWERKRPAIAKHSVLRLNQLICERETWDEEAIEERARWLADQVAEVWPTPTVVPPAEEATGTEVSNDPDTLDERLSDDDLEVLHELLWESASQDVDGEGWRLHTSGLEPLLKDLGVVDLGDHVPEDIRRDAFERLVGDGRVERIGGADDDQLPQLRVRPLP